MSINQAATSKPPNEPYDSIRHFMFVNEDKLVLVNDDQDGQNGIIQPDTVITDNNVNHNAVCHVPLSFVDLINVNHIGQAIISATATTTAAGQHQNNNIKNSRVIGRRESRFNQRQDQQQQQQHYPEQEIISLILNNKSIKNISSAHFWRHIYRLPEQNKRNPLNIVFYGHLQQQKPNDQNNIKNNDIKNNGAKDHRTRQEQLLIGGDCLPTNNNQQHFNIEDSFEQQSDRHQPPPPATTPGQQQGASFIARPSPSCHRVSRRRLPYSNNEQQQSPPGQQQCLIATVFDEKIGSAAKQQQPAIDNDKQQQRQPQSLVNIEHNIWCCHSQTNSNSIVVDDSSHKQQKNLLRNSHHQQKRDHHSSLISDAVVKDCDLESFDVGGDCIASADRHHKQIKTNLNVDNDKSGDAHQPSIVASTSNVCTLHGNGVYKQPNGLSSSSSTNINNHNRRNILPPTETATKTSNQTVNEHHHLARSFRFQQSTQNWKHFLKNKSNKTNECGLYNTNKTIAGRRHNLPSKIPRWIGRSAPSSCQQQQQFHKQDTSCTDIIKPTLLNESSASFKCGVDDDKNKPQPPPSETITIFNDTFANSLEKCSSQPPQQQQQQEKQITRTNDTEINKKSQLIITSNNNSIDHPYHHSSDIVVDVCNNQISNKISSTQVSNYFKPQPALIINKDNCGSNQNYNLVTCNQDQTTNSDHQQTAIVTQTSSTCDIWTCNDDNKLDHKFLIQSKWLLSLPSINSQLKYPRLFPIVKCCTCSIGKNNNNNKYLLDNGASLLSTAASNPSQSCILRLCACACVRCARNSQNRTFYFKKSSQINRNDWLECASYLTLFQHQQQETIVYDNNKLNDDDDGDDYPLGSNSQDPSQHQRSISDNFSSTCFLSESRTNSRSRRLEEMFPKGILILEPQFGLPPKRKSPPKLAKNIKFADCDPEIIGYRYPSDDEEEDELEDFQLQQFHSLNNKSCNQVDDETDDDENDVERLQLKKLTESNTLFNSNYGNFKAVSEGVLGKPKTDSGPVKFQISDSYQRPLATDTFPTNSIRQIFEKNNNNNSLKAIDNEKTKPKTVVSNYRDVFENITNKNQSKNDEQIQIPKVKLSNKLPQQSTSPTATSDISNNANNQIVMQKFDIIDNNIRIPRASIQPDKIINNNSKCDEIKLKTITTTNSNHHESSPPPLPSKPKPDCIPEPDPIKANNQSVILVDNREGSILTLDSKNITKIENDDSELFYLPTLKDDCSSNKNSESRSNTNQSANLDSLSQSSTASTSSGCCSANSSSHSTSPTSNIEESCSSTPPESLESSPDCYDCSKSNHDDDEGDCSDESSDKTVENDVDDELSTCKVLKDNNNQSRYKEVSVPDLETSDKPATVTVVNQRSILDQPLSSCEQQVDNDEIAIASDINHHLLDQHDKTITNSHLQNNNKQIINFTKISSAMFKELDDSDSTLSNNNNVTIDISATESEERSHSPPLTSSQDKRSQMLAKMALDLQRHRNESNLSRSDSNQSSVSSNKSQNTESFRERLIREASEDVDRGSPMKFHFKMDSLSDLASDSDSSDDEQDDVNGLMVQENDDSLSESDKSSSDESDEADHQEKFTSHHKKSFSKLFKNVVNSNKKYTKMMKKNLNKTSKFIVNTTQQLRHDTSDMVKKLKNDRKSFGVSNSSGSNSIFYGSSDAGCSEATTSSNNNQKFKHKWTIMEHSSAKNEADLAAQQNDTKYKTINSAQLSGQHHHHHPFEASSSSSSTAGSNNKNKIFKLNFDMRKSKSSNSAARWHSVDGTISSSNHQETKSKSSCIEPTLVKVKRLESTKYKQSPSSLNGYCKPVIQPKQSLHTISEHHHLPPPPPPSSSAAPSDINHHQEPAPQPPPQAPLRRKKIMKKCGAASSSANDLTLNNIKADFEKNLNVIDNLETLSSTPSSSSLDDFVNIVEDCKLSFKDYRLYRCSLKHSCNQAYLLTSNTFWVTCYDQDENFNIQQRYFQNQPCRLLATKWTSFISIASFCERLNQLSSTNEHRASLVDSIVLQLYTILARFEKATTVKASQRKCKPLTVGDINTALVAISTSQDKQEMEDVLLLLPAIEIENEESSFELDSLLLVQAFCLQVFLMRLTRLIATNHCSDGDDAPKKHRICQLSHYANVSNRLQRFSSLNELKILSMVDVFRIAPNKHQQVADGQTTCDESSLINIKQQIDDWFQERRSSNYFAQRFYKLNPHQSSSTFSKQNVFIPGSILDYLEIDFVLNHDPNVTYELVYKEISDT